MDDIIVRLHRPRTHFAEIVDEQDALPGNFKAVWRLVDLSSHPASRVRAERFSVAVVPAEHAEERHSLLVKRR